ncbi:MAG: dihydroxyacetone kinase subunit L [Desulfurococcaceae archaeon]|nr:dihydroxyacetone kinase subunit L [Desulfurococcaceae archaeon]
MNRKIYSMDSKKFCEILMNIAECFSANEEYLNWLDGQIGDGDFGTNVSRGFRKIRDILQQRKDLEQQDIGTILQEAAMQFMQVSGGASGPLIGMMFLEASKVMKGKKNLYVKDLLDMFSSMLRAVKLIGGAEIGDKTMVDVLQPVVEDMKKIIEKEKDIDMVKLFELLVKTAKIYLEKTIGMKARKGRASYLGERSIGKQDPGATAIYLIIRTFYETLNGKRSVKIIEYSRDSGAIIKEEIF